MEVRPLEVGLIEPIAAQTPARAAAIAPPLRSVAEVTAAVLPEIGDSVVLLLQQLSQPDLARLLTILDRLPPPETPSPIDQAGVGSTDRLVLSVPASQQASSQQLALISPQIASHGSLVTAPELDQAPHHVLAVAHLDAETKLAHATRLVDDLRPASLPNWDAKPEVMLHLARTFVDAGTYVNYVRAADLSQIMIDALRFMPVFGAAPINENWSARFLTGLQRAPWPVAVPALLALLLLVSILLGWWGSH